MPTTDPGVLEHNLPRQSWREHVVNDNLGPCRVGVASAEVDHWAGALIRHNACQLFSTSSTVLSADTFDVTGFNGRVIHVGVRAEYSHRVGSAKRIWVQFTRVLPTLIQRVSKQHVPDGTTNAPVVTMCRHVRQYGPFCTKLLEFKI